MPPPGGCARIKHGTCHDAMFCNYLKLLVMTQFGRIPLREASYAVLWTPSAPESDKNGAVVSENWHFGDQITVLGRRRGVRSILCTRGTALSVLWAEATGRFLLNPRSL